MANFRYSVKDSVRPDQYAELKTGAYELFDSRCDETMVGVKFNSDEKAIQCWVGYQTMPFLTEKPTESKTLAPLLLAQTGSSASQKSTMEVLKPAKKHSHSIFSEVSEEERQNYANLVNEANLGWKADSYATEGGHPSINLAQTTSRRSKKFGDNSEDFNAALSLARRFFNVPID